PDLLGRRSTDVRIRMVRPGVELDEWAGSGQDLREQPRRDRLLDALLRRRLQAPARRRLADRDQRAPVAGLDPGVAGAGEACVDQRRPRLPVAAVGGREEL